MIGPFLPIFQSERVMVPFSIESGLVPENELTSAVKLTIFEISVVCISLLVDKHPKSVGQPRLILSLMEAPFSFTATDAMSMDVTVHLALIPVFEPRIDVSVVVIKNSDLMRIINLLNFT